MAVCASGICGRERVMFSLCICHALCQCHYVSADVSDGAGFLDIRPLFYMTLSEAAVIVLWTLERFAFTDVFFLPEICCWCTGDRPVEDILQKFATRKDKYQVSKTIHIGMGAG